MMKIDILKSLRFGERIAEDELNDLEKYFVATDQWNRVFSGEVDIVYGPKGSGKSALYALLDKRKDALFDKNILVQGPENLCGNTAFADLLSDPPPTERSFIELWKLYLLILSVSSIKEYGINARGSEELIDAITDAGLLPAEASLGQMFKRARSLIWSYIFPERESVENTLSIDPVSGLPIVTRKTNFRAQELSEHSQTDIPLDDLLQRCDNVLNAAGYELWILFDRLDVAFNDTPEVEKNALRALFRAYNDLKGFDSINLKIFVRDDIWDRISEGGFAEASHITKTISINWSYESLINLFVRRLINNGELLSYLNKEYEDVIDNFELQKEILEEIFPDKVETGNNPETFRWMVNRIQDASGKPAPRELIHLSECIRRQQVDRFERGEEGPDGSMLFERVVFKPALSEVSQTRYQQTFVAENPSLKKYTDLLDGQKAEQDLQSLSDLWTTDSEETAEISERLIKSGFLGKRNTNGKGSYWTPFIYRDALNLIQGKTFE